MARLGGLVDLSLFAISPTDDRRFTAPYVSPTERIPNEASCYRAQRELNHRHGRDFVMKPLPPLPHRRICERRLGTRGVDPNPRCILKRIRRVRTHEHLGNQSPSLQQRRAVTVPQLTLSLPQTSQDGENGGNGANEGNVRPTMIWLPEEQMWFIQNQVDQNANQYLWSYPMEPIHQYARSEPSPDRSAHFDLTPLESFHNQYLNLDEPPDEIRDQFLRLIGPQQDERLSPLFQEAIQSVPPMTDPSPSTPHFSYQFEPGWVPRNSYETYADGSRTSSEHQSYHTANVSLTEEPMSISQSTEDLSSLEQRGSIVAPNSRISSWADYRGNGNLRLTRENLWNPVTNASLAEEQMSVVSQFSRTPWSPWGYTADDSVLDEPRSVVSQVTQDRPWGEEPRNIITPITNDTSWEVLARRVARPASAMN